MAHGVHRRGEFRENVASIQTQLSCFLPWCFLVGQKDEEGNSVGGGGGVECPLLLIEDGPGVTAPRSLPLHCFVTWDKTLALSGLHFHNWADGSRSFIYQDGVQILS